MKNVLVVTCGLAVLRALTFAAFVAGLECGHRMGYDSGWRDCKFDAKQTLHQKHNDPDDSFWMWYGSTNSVIRKRRSLFE